MRSHGVARFPDPTAQGQLSVEMVQAQGIDVHSPAVLHVVQACLPASHGALTRREGQRGAQQRRRLTRLPSTRCSNRAPPRPPGGKTGTRGAEAADSPTRSRRTAHIQWGRMSQSPYVHGWRRFPAPYLLTPVVAIRTVCHPSTNETCRSKPTHAGGVNVAILLPRPVAPNGEHHRLKRRNPRAFVAARDRLTPVTKVVTGIAMSSQIKDKTAGEEILRASGLDWTIVYPTKPTNGPKTEARVVPENEKVGASQKISRAGVASFLLQAATEGLHSRRGVVITG